MLNRWVVSLFMLLALSATSCQHVRGPDIGHKSDKRQKAQPAAIFLNGKTLTNILLKDDNSEKHYQDDSISEKEKSAREMNKNIRDVLRDKNLKGDDFIEEIKKVLDVEKFTGFSSLIARNLVGIRNSILHPKPINNDDDKILKSDICYKALEEKKEWHRQYNKVPESFGQIVHYGFIKHYKNNWGGPLAVCTLYDNNVYYIEMEFYHKTRGSLRAVKRQGDVFPNTLDLSGWTNEDRDKMQNSIKSRKLGWKLHAKANPLVYKIITAKENGIDMDPSDSIFQVNSNDCFDMFFRHYPPQAWQALPPHSERCLGRCDARILNTAE